MVMKGQTLQNFSSDKSRFKVFLYHVDVFVSFVTKQPQEQLLVTDRHTVCCVEAALFLGRSPCGCQSPPRLRSGCACACGVDSEVWRFGQFQALGFRPHIFTSIHSIFSPGKKAACKGHLLSIDPACNQWLPWLCGAPSSTHFLLMALLPEENRACGGRVLFLFYCTVLRGRADSRS